MQNKGFVKFFAVLLTLVCLFYLSFSIVSRHYEKKAEKIAGGDTEKYNQYLDSLAGEKVWLNYTLKEVREQEINLGLDLKGGMNVVMEVSVSDILQALAGDKRTDEAFVAAIAEAKKMQLTNSQKDFVDLFREAFEKANPDARLATIFSNFDLKEKIAPTATNTEVINVLKSEITSAVENSFNVLRSRIDRFGVVQPNIQRLEVAGRILIELPGVKEPERVRKLLQGSADLEFCETINLTEIYNNVVAVNNMARDLENIQSKKEEVAETPTTEVAVATTDTATAAKSVDDLDALVAAQDTAAVDKTQEEWKKENPLFAIMQLSADESGRIHQSPVIGTVHIKDTAKVARYFRLAKEKRILPATVIPKWTVKAAGKGGNYFQLIAIYSKQRDGKAPLTGAAVSNATVQFENNSPHASVSMEMNQEGARKWAQLTKENIGKSIAIVLDGYVYSFPNVNQEITGGRSSITGQFTTEEAQDLANVLKSGKMPAPARIVQEDVVGPSLGQEAIQYGLVSFIVSFIIVLLYMMVYYGFIPGLVADVALLANVFFIFGALASFQAVLTLPGIAGVVLTLAMAIDANVLIYERVREELKAGKHVKMAVADGYKNALSTIIDANLTTVIVGIILFVYGTGPIQGFATTLLIGILCSFFTAIFLTRLIFDRLLQKEKFQNLAFTSALTKNFLQNIKFEFIAKRKRFYLMTGVIMLILLGSIMTRSVNWGIDFTGGRNYIIRFENPVKTTDISDLLKESFGDESVAVITIGGDNQVRISTNFMITDNSEEIDAEIVSRLFTGLQPQLHEGVTEALFATGYSVLADGQVVPASGDVKGDSFGIQSSQKVGPTMADDIKTSAGWAVLFALLGIGAYILLRFFNVSWTFSLGAVIALAHDALFIIGIYSLLYSIMPFSLEIDQSFIAAILTVIGYSINDKVVIFDRIREYVGLYPNRPMNTVMNDAICSTMGRTFSTSLSTLLVLIVIFIFGGEVIRGFIFAMTIGVVVGTYSSIFLAAPLSYDMLEMLGKKKASKAELTK